MDRRVAMSGAICIDFHFKNVDMSVNMKEPQGVKTYF